MNIFVYGHDSGVLRHLLEERGFRLVSAPEQADLMLTYGGDGAMLGAVHLHPDQLIFPVRDVATAPLCPAHSLERQFDALRAGGLKVTRLPRLCGQACGRTLSGVNDIFIHNKVSVSAMRYDVWIDSELYGREVVGDGVGVSTVHGSTAYYRSITHSVFRTGIGLAFSNSTELVNHLVLPESARIKVRILRGPCEMVTDNSPETIPLSEGDEAVIYLSGKLSPILGLDVFMCPRCRAMRHDLRRTRLDGGTAL